MSDISKEKVTHPKYQNHKKNDIINKEKPLSTTKYVDNARFLELVIKHRERKTTKRELDEIGGILLKISNGLAQKYQFRNYPFVEDMVTEAVLHAWNYFDNFDPTITKNPFSYFTQICYYNFLQTIKEEKHVLATKFKSSLITIAEHGDKLDDERQFGDIETDSITSDYDIDVSAMSEFVDNYDKFLETNKAKAKAKAKEKAKAAKGVDKFMTSKLEDF